MRTRLRGILVLLMLMLMMMVLFMVMMKTVLKLLVVNMGLELDSSFVYERWINPLFVDIGRRLPITASTQGIRFIYKTFPPQLD